MSPGTEPTSLVLIHGFAGGPASWDAAVQALPPVRGRTLRVVLPGHAPAVGVAAGFAANVDDVACQIRQGVPGPRWVVGYSMGARVALGLLAQHGQLFAGAVLIGCHPGLEQPSQRQQRIAADQAWADGLRAQGIGPFVAAWERLPLFASQAAVPEAARRRQRELRLAHDPQRLAACLENLGLGQMPSYRRLLADSRLPIEWVVGAQDDKFLGLAQEVGAQHDGPSLRLTVLPACGHNPLLEAPAALAEVLGRTPAVAGDATIYRA